MANVLEQPETKEPNNRPKTGADQTTTAPSKPELEVAPSVENTNGSASIEKSEEHVTAHKPIYKRVPVIVAAAIVLLVAAIIGGRYLLYARAHESTDDAFIDGHVVQISPKASGYVTRVYVDDNQLVKEGDLIVEIDVRDYVARLQQVQGALAAAEARHNEATNSVSLTRAQTAAAIQQAEATVNRARSNVQSSRQNASSVMRRASQAEAEIKTAQANVAQAQSQVAAAQAESIRANADVERYQALYAKDEVSKQQLDLAVATARTANAEVDAAQQKVTSLKAQVEQSRLAHAASVESSREAQTQIGSAEATVNEQLGRLAESRTAPQQIAVSQAQAQTAGATVQQLKAEVTQAELNLSYTKIYATETGRITRKTVEEGALVQIGQPLLAIVPENVWVTANFKESQIGLMAPGQPVEISVDAYPGKVFKGHVDSLQAGTGARFSLLPPENATGNYVKVVQRVPVKIVFDDPPDPNHLLAPGMSVVPEVKVR